LIKPVGKTLIVAHNDKACASLAPYGSKQLKKAVPMQVVKGRGRLIGKNERGLTHEGSRRCNTLLLTHRELMGSLAPKLWVNTQLLKQALSLFQSRSMQSTGILVATSKESSGHKNIVEDRHKTQ
jgi:hypothetical protein